jgi:fatty acid desaturase
VLSDRAKLVWDDLVPFFLPAVMIVLGNCNIFEVFKMWTFMILTSSLIHGFVGLNAGHHEENIFHDGDDLKSVDFGVYQLSATAERLEIKNSPFLTLIGYGNHVLHHLFPSLDHAILPQLNEILLHTCLEFECDLKEYPWWKLVIGQFNQLSRTEPKRSAVMGRPIVKTKTSSINA